MFKIKGVTSGWTGRLPWWWTREGTCGETPKDCERVVALTFRGDWWRPEEGGGRSGPKEKLNRCRERGQESRSLWGSRRVRGPTGSVHNHVDTLSKQRAKIRTD